MRISSAFQFEHSIKVYVMESKIWQWKMFERIVIFTSAWTLRKTFLEEKYCISLFSLPIWFYIKWKLSAIYLDFSVTRFADHYFIAEPPLFLAWYNLSIKFPAAQDILTPPHYFSIYGLYSLFRQTRIHTQTLWSLPFFQIFEISEPIPSFFHTCLPVYLSAHSPSFFTGFHPTKSSQLS